MNDKGEWKAGIYENFSNRTFEVFIYGIGCDIKMQLSDATKGITTRRQEGKENPPSMILTAGMMQALFEAMQEKGMKPKDQSFIEGKLEAQDKHLEDMRTLVFKKKHD